jgi:hypothetical protein
VERALDTLTQYFEDTEKMFDKTFGMLALKHKPEVLQTLLKNDQNRKSLEESLCSHGFCPEASQLMS